MTAPSRLPDLLTYYLNRRSQTQLDDDDKPLSPDASSGLDNSSPPATPTPRERRVEPAPNLRSLWSTPTLRRSHSLSSLPSLGGISPLTALASSSPQHSEASLGDENLTYPQHAPQPSAFSWFNRTTILPSLGSPGRSRSQPPEAPSSGTSFVPSPPIRGRTHAERAASQRENQARKRKEAEDAAQRRKHEQKATIMNATLDSLNREGYTFGDLVLYVSDPQNWAGNHRYRGFFSVPGRVEAVLNHWVSSEHQHEAGRTVVKNWAVNYISKCIDDEGKKVAADGFLRTDNKTVDDKFALKFSFPWIREKLSVLCPTLITVLEAACTTTRQRKEMSSQSRKQKDTAIMTAALVCLGERSKRNDYVKALFGLYSCAEGAHRQLITCLSHFGLSLSYSSLMGKSKYHDLDLIVDPGSDGGDRQDPLSITENSELRLEAAGENDGGADAVNEIEKGQVHHREQEKEEERGGKKKKAQAGFLRRLSDACRLAVRLAAMSDLLAYVYDNINFAFKVAEQVVGRKDSQENGTCSTAFQLYGASLTNLQTTDYLRNLLGAPPLSLNDITLSTTENNTLNTHLEHAILRTLVLFGGERFKKYANDVLAATPVMNKIALHKTVIFPLPAVPIDESSIVGNAAVLDHIFHEVRRPLSTPGFGSILKLIAGDQLSISRIRSLIFNRAGHDSLANSFLWVVPIPGLFHYKMALTHGFMEKHYGTNSISNPGSLAFHNTILGRKPIVLSSLPPFRTSRDLIFVSLYARIFHCLLLVSGFDSLDSFANADISYEVLQGYVREIRTQFANPTMTATLRRARKREELQRTSAASARPTEGDMVFENAVLYMRDALVLREFNDAVKAGDSGRVCLVLKMLATMYRGMGRNKYAHEMMHLVHNLTSVWPEGLRSVVLQNWLVNPTGKENAWVEVDLMQEHMNYWIKTIYRARGSNASWEWLAMVAPCVNILRELAKQVNQTFGSHQGTRHTSPDLQRDIDRLMASLKQCGVYTVEPGRTIESDSPVVPNVISEGLKNLREPLRDYNTLFTHLQSRVRMTPLVGERYILEDEPTILNTHAASPTGPSPAAATSPVGAPQDEAPADEDEAHVDEDEPLGDVNSVPNESDSDSDADDEYDSEDRWFSLDTAEDVALDMDALDEEEDDDNDDNDGNQSGGE